MVYYKLENINYCEYDVGENKYKLDLLKLIVTKINEQYSLVINTFKDTCILVETSVLLDDEGVGINLYRELETPNKDNMNIFLNLINNTNKEYNQYKNQIVTFILAITYACNLKCTYCYQQSDATLKKTLISEANLEIVLGIILEYKNNNPEKQIEIGLFGGEPLLPSNEKIIDEIFDFCKNNKIKVHITTNGTYLEFFMKKLIINRNIISSINPTIDNIDDNEATRAYLNFDSSYYNNKSTYLLKCVKTLINYNVNVNLATNIDSLNLKKISYIFNFLNKNDFINNEYFIWSIGRVDDRLFETKYPYIVTESDILKELIKIDYLPNNVHAAFIKTGLNIVKKIHLDFNQTELVDKYNYCFASSTMDKVFYIDNDLDVFRCPYTVGRKKYSINKLSYELIDFNLYNRNYINLEGCIECKLGGYCSGGCALAYKKDKQKQCNYEKSCFEQFLYEILIPYIKKSFHEFNKD